MAFMKWLKKAKVDDLPEHCGLCVNFKKLEHTDARGVYWDGFCRAREPDLPTGENFVCCCMPSEFVRQNDV